jgi:dipeptidyl aminopeptidase/acylaminoacyl peptidase
VTYWRNLLKQRIDATYCNTLLQHLIDPTKASMAYFSSEDDPVRAPYGTWRSPLSAAVVAQGATPLSQSRIALDPANGNVEIYCLQARASDGGRTTLLRWDDKQAGAALECTPAPFNVRSRVHEYGGGAYLVTDQGIAFSHFADNRLYWMARDSTAGALALTPAGKARYADFVHDSAHARLIAVRELHSEDGAQPVNTLCAIGLPPAGDGQPAPETVLAQGHDFYAAPRLSPDGSQLAWLSWDHPRMPWEGCELWLAAVREDGSLGQAECIAGGAAESICQPSWSPDGALYFVSDRSGWWNLYRQPRSQGAAVVAVCPMSVEWGSPHWTFGQSRYAFNGADEIICAFIDMGVSHLARLDLRSGAWTALASRQAAHYTDIQEIRVAAGCAVLLAGSPRTPLELLRIELATGAVTVLARAIAAPPDPAYLSIPESIDYPSGGRRVHAFFYRPTNRDFVGNTRALPPLIVIGHGGPTGMASSTLSLATQYWTSRGFAVLDVNYRGSSGFGRAYRHALKGQWGIADVEDCVNGARFLTEHNMVDGHRLIIRGGSAGGFTTLCALAFHKVFKAGAIYYGVSDLQAIDADSHKFESHYNSYLIGPKPQAEALYLQRSPIHHAGELSEPMIFFQGLDDKVVPPAQSEVMVKALQARGVPVAYLTFAGEGHGFRQAPTIIRTLEAELYFYARIFGLQLPEQIEAVEIANLPEPQAEQ